MAKGPWEERVGRLLIPKGTNEYAPDFLWSHKCPDMIHGGQPKVDFHACDRTGVWWSIEVKQIPEARKSFNIDSRDFISAGQIECLTAVAQASASVVLLAVGRGNRLYIFDWRRLQCQYRERTKANFPKPGLFQLAEALTHLTFTRWASWEETPFRHGVLTLLEVERKSRRSATRMTKRSPSNSSPKPGESASTLKPTASILTNRTRTSKITGTSTVTRKPK